MIQLFRPSLGEEEVQAVREVLLSGWVGLGPKTALFEERFAAFVESRHCVATNSATAALHLAVLLLRPKPEDEIILPALTFVSTAHCVVQAGARVVLADVDPKTLTLDPVDVARKVSPRTRAIIAMDYGGHPSRLDELRQIAEPAGALLIEDAAHSAGAKYKGRRVGGIADVTCFSFQAIKNMTTGEGGAVTTHSAELTERLRLLRNCGISRDTWSRLGRETWDWYYEVKELGYKYHMSDVAAAIGLVQLTKLDRLNALRREKTRRYDEAFAGVAWLETPTIEPWVESSHHNYAVKLDARDDLARHLKEREVMTSVHYLPLHHHPFYRALEPDVPETERVWMRLLLLPLHAELSTDDQDRVIEGVSSFGRARGLSR